MNDFCVLNAAGSQHVVTTLRSDPETSDTVTEEQLMTPSRIALDAPTVRRS
jgi:hypothetical protein